MRSIVFIVTVVSCVLAAVIFTPGSLFADTTTADQNSSPNPASNGYFSTRYLYRSASGADPARDQDVFGELRIDTAPKNNRYEFHFFGTVRSDLSGNRDRSTFYPLEDIGDTYRSRTHGYLYEAHLDLNNALAWIPQIRIGRQAGTRDEPVFFDGAAADISACSRLNLTVYGGAAVHFYEIGSHWGDDELSGAGLDYSPFSATKLSVDYLSVKDEQVHTGDVELHDRMISLKWWQRIGSLMKASVKYRYLDGEPRDVGVRAVTAFPEADTEVNVNYFRQFRVQNELSTDLSLYDSVLGQSSPYQSFDLKARKLFGRHYAVDAGYFKRSLLEESLQNSFDRDFSRAFLLFEWIDLPRDGVSFTFITDRWETTGRDYVSAGLDAGYKFQRVKKASINAGTYFSLYKYDYSINPGVREQVRTYYLNGKYPAGKSISINGGFEYEDSIENYQTFKLGLRYDF